MKTLKTLLKVAWIFIQAFCIAVITVVIISGLLILAGVWDK